MGRASSVLITFAVSAVITNILYAVQESLEWKKVIHYNEMLAGECHLTKSLFLFVSLFLWRSLCPTLSLSHSLSLSLSLSVCVCVCQFEVHQHGTGTAFAKDDGSDSNDSRGGGGGVGRDGGRFSTIVAYREHFLLWCGVLVTGVLVAIGNILKH